MGLANQLSSFNQAANVRRLEVQKLDQSFCDIQKKKKVSLPNFVLKQNLTGAQIISNQTTMHNVPFSVSLGSTA